MSGTTTPTYEVRHRAAQPAATVTRTVSMTTSSEAADEIPPLLGWLAAHGQAPSGPPFLRYLVIDMAADLVVQAGVPVAVPVPDDLPGDVWASRVEWYETNPVEEPDPARWVTRLELRLADG